MLQIGVIYEVRYCNMNIIPLKISFYVVCQCHEMVIFTNICNLLELVANKKHLNEPNQDGILSIPGIFRGELHLIDWTKNTLNFVEKPATIMFPLYRFTKKFPEILIQYQSEPNSLGIQKLIPLIYKCNGS